MSQFFVLQNPPRNIPGIYYRANCETPIAIRVTTTIPDVENAFARRFPSFESILGTRAFIHECLVTCFDTAGKGHRFLLAYQECSDLPPNRALLKVFPEAQFRGELVVMRAGKRSLVIALKGKKDAQLAEDAVRRFLLEVTARRARNSRLRHVPDLPVALL
ncbi:hypothetical protein C8Q73DRAFT_795990 [Cubamyces lactineus]|nr:hypothetical protein C8Q73DRAFT_795990 [Cubamyces lactineus]